MRKTAPLRSSRRRACAPFVALALLPLSACATFTNNSTAATIDGREIPRDQFERFVDEFASNEQLPIVDGVVAIEDARNLLAGIIKADAYTAFLDDLGSSLSDDQRQEVRDQLAGQNVGGLSDDLIDLIVELNAATKAISGIQAPNESRIEKLYNERPSLTGAMCARHVVVKKKKTAQKVLSMLANGADFATLAKKYSIEPAAKTSGGALEGQTADGESTPCMSILEYQQGFDPDFTRGAIAASAGVPFGPVQSSFGWHVILLAPWDEVSEAVLNLVAAEPGPNLATGWLANAEVSVDPAYGRWDPATGTIVAN